MGPTKWTVFWMLGLLLVFEISQVTEAHRNGDPEVYSIRNLTAPLKPQNNIDESPSGTKKPRSEPPLYQNLFLQGGYAGQGVADSRGGSETPRSQQQSAELQALIRVVNKLTKAEKARPGKTGGGSDAARSRQQLSAELTAVVQAVKNIIEKEDRQVGASGGDDPRRSQQKNAELAALDHAATKLIEKETRRIRGSRSGFGALRNQQTAADLRALDRATQKLIAQEDSRLAESGGGQENPDGRQIVGQHGNSGGQKNPDGRQIVGQHENGGRHEPEVVEDKVRKMFASPRKPAIIDLRKRPVDGSEEHAEQRNEGGEDKIENKFGNFGGVPPVDFLNLPSFERKHQTGQQKFGQNRQNYGSHKRHG